MAYSINKVILVGNVGNEPELKTFQSGDRVINFLRFLEKIIITIFLKKKFHQSLNIF